MCPAPPMTGEDIDWNEVWKARQRRHEAARIFDDPSHDWSKRENAQRYDANAKSEYDERVKMTIAGLDISKNSRVLDIGAGPGTLALPLSPLVKEVTAIEPGAGMIGILNEHAAKNHITNIRTIQSRWEDIEPARDLKAPYDIVIASLSLTMEDIRESLVKDERGCQSVRVSVLVHGLAVLGTDVWRSLAIATREHILSRAKSRLPLECALPDGDLCKRRDPAAP